jgi:hypothetical protein
MQSAMAPTLLWIEPQVPSVFPRSAQLQSYGLDLQCSRRYFPHLAGSRLPSPFSLAGPLETASGSQPMAGSPPPPSQLCPAPRASSQVTASNNNAKNIFDQQLLDPSQTQWRQRTTDWCAWRTLSSVGRIFPAFARTLFGF